MKFKKGDRVRVLRKAQSQENGWQNSWISYMDEAVGKIGRVTYISPALAHDVTVDVLPNGRIFGYPDFVLRKITPKKRVRHAQP